ncbi:hypothetical protein ACRAWD_16650 [Caulobacter segnis]
MALNSLVTLDITKFQYTDGMGDVSRISPDNWVHDQALLDRSATATSSWTCRAITAPTCRSIRTSRSSSATTSRRC